MSRSRDSGPTSCYSLAFCTHLIAYGLICVAAFTPKWASVTEKGVTDITYDKGLILSCNVPGGSAGCGFNKDVAGSSDEFFICFLLMISSIVIGFLVFQVLVCGACVKSFKTKNLGVPLVLLFFLLGILAVACIVLFELSITKDITTGNEYVDHDFGTSRILLIAVVCLYFLSAFFALGEYFKRKTDRSVSHDDDEDTIYSIDTLPASPSPIPDNDKAIQAFEDNDKAIQAFEENDKGVQVSDSNEHDKSPLGSADTKPNSSKTASVLNNDTKNNDEVNNNNNNNDNNNNKAKNRWKATRNKLALPMIHPSFNKTKRKNASVVALEGHTYFR